MGLGTLLLKLPASTHEGISWVNALFVAVSAVSVTGLSSVDYLSTFTTFGSTVIMLLVQVGGLGAIVLVVGFIRGGFGYGDSLFQAVFHAIMAFCNAGFTTLPNRGLFPYAGDPAVNSALITLIILGGLGFPVLVNLYRYQQVRRLTLHSKLVLVTTAALILIGVLSVALLEWGNPGTLGDHASETRLWMSLLQGVTPRTAGFSTVDYAQMREPTLFVQMGLMFVGTAPSSTGGGVKVTTLAILVLLLLSQAQGQEEVSAFGRRVPTQLMQKVLVVLSLSALLVIVATLALMISDDLRLLPAIFEITSAFGTVGLSLNVTPELTAFGKLLVAGVMLLGRVGPITLILALSARQKGRGYVLPRGRT